MSDRLYLTAALMLMGIGWGLSVPLGKIAVSTGYQPFGLVFWQAVIVAVALNAINLVRGKRLVLRRDTLARYAMVAALGSVIPGWAYYMSVLHLPGGVLSILISCVPILSFPIALLLGNDRFSAVRLGGLAFGMTGILLLIGPEASLPDPAMAAFIPLALIMPLCYACEGNAVAHWGTAGLDPIQVIAGASVLSALVMAPVAVLTGQWFVPVRPWGAAETALTGIAAIQAAAYTLYVWLVGRAGSVFAAQVAYLVTIFGVAWSIAILGESYSGYIWASLAAMLVGLALVQPRPRLIVVPIPPEERP